jgi:ADP-heptose:LPS heptosyltransferase
MKSLGKILVVRFSSIGDIVLTTPILRAIRSRYPGVVVHFVARAKFADVVRANPNVDRLFTFERTIHEVVPQLKNEKYDLVIDLHRNFRSLMLRSRLMRPSVAFDKINLRKFMAVNFKMKDVLPEKHIVERYFDALAPYDVRDDGNGLDYFIPKEDEVNADALFLKNKPGNYIALVIGGSYNTKKIPLEKLRQICSVARLPVVLLGGKDDKPVADLLRREFPHLANCSGLFSVNQSASVVRQAEWVITSDTGMMHIAAAFDKKIVSVWGNTVPEFGMYPYRPHSDSILMEVKGLKCRPCSKLGFAKCPRKHFKCMMDHDFSFVKGLR